MSRELAAVAPPDSAAGFARHFARRAVLAELGRAVLELLLLVPRLLAWPLRRGAALAEVRALLAGEGATLERAARPPLPARPLVIALSCAEPSGELHACGLARALRAELAARGAPPPRLVGLGGARLAAEHVALWARPVERATMGLSGVASSLPYWLRLLALAARELARERPDVLVLVDSPALHVPLGRIARKAGVPSVHLVAPQYWAWAPWRARAYRRAIDRALTILPFERAWLARRGVQAAHVGHPLLDAPRASGAEREPARVASTAAARAPRTLVLLPGSRKSVVRANLPWMLATAALLRAALVEERLEVVVAHEREELEEELGAHLRAAGADAWARLEPRALGRELARAHLALSVSGTVLLELLRHDLPAVVVYRVEHRLEAWLGPKLLSVPWFSSVNLLAGREVYPEFCFAGAGPSERILAALARAWRDEGWRADCRRGLALARERLGPPGALTRTAEHALELAARGGAR